MSEQLLSQIPQSADGILGWMIAAIIFLSGIIMAMGTWYAKVREPAFSAQIQAILMDSAKLLVKDRDDFNKRLDSKEKAYREDMRQQHIECREERQQRDAEMSTEINRLQTALTDLTKVLQEHLGGDRA